jgi:hypothetical protein
MDRVRFGRALGYGARHAAKSLAKAVEAATAANPVSHSTPPGAAAQPPRAASIVNNLAEAHQTVQQAKRQIKNEAKTYAQASAKTQARALGKSAWAPLAKFSSVVWLQVTGSFFLLIALFFGQGLWTSRHQLLHPANPTEGRQLTLHAVIFAAFLYFALSNFLRARRRERK